MGVFSSNIIVFETKISQIRHLHLNNFDRECGSSQVDRNGNFFGFPTLA